MGPFCLVEVKSSSTPLPAGPVLRRVQVQEPEVGFLTSPVLVSSEKYRHRRRASWSWPPCLWDIVQGDIFCGNKNQYSLYKKFILVMYAHVYIFMYFGSIHAITKKTCTELKRKRRRKIGAPKHIRQIRRQAAHRKEDIHARAE